MPNVQILSRALTVVLALACSRVSAARSEPDAMELELSGGGVTSYVIVKPDNATPVDSYAVRILAEGLKQKTGVTFPVVASAGAGEQKRICVGVSAAAEKDLGRDPRPAMRDQEFAVRSIGQNICLYGKGVHGNLYAVVDFLDNTLERRWCVDEYYEKPSFNRLESLAIKPFARSRAPSFAYRMLGFPNEFNYQYGYNICLPPEVRAGWGLPEGTLPVFDNPVWVHTSFLYIPPDPGRGFPWLKDQGYFATHPEFYGENINRQRMPEQLCYANPGLRAELTKNILTHIGLLRKEKTDDRPILIALDQEDPATGKFCYCDACAALEQRYHSPAGQRCEAFW